jgi:hypothetical protein
MLPAVMFQLTMLAAAPLGFGYVETSSATSELIAKYVSALQTLDAAQRNANVEVTVQARLTKLNRQATLRAVRATSPSGETYYETQDASGDDMVRREVIARYLTAVSQKPDTAEMSVTPSHYRFQLTRMMEEPNRRIYVFRLTPKMKRPGLFKGELWVDGQTGKPVHESGRFVKNPSVFIKRITFSRDYETRNASGLPVYIHCIVNTRIAGPAELTIRTSLVSQPEAEAGNSAEATRNAE